MKKILFQTFLILPLFFFLSVTPISAQGSVGVRPGVTPSIWTTQGCAIDGVATIQGIQCVLIRLTQFFVPLIIIAAVLMILYAGAQIIAGADNPKAVAQGRQTLTFAIIGLIGIVGSWVILVLIQTFTGAPVTVLDTIAPF